VPQRNADAYRWRKALPCAAFIEGLTDRLAGMLGDSVSRTGFVGTTARACRVAGADAMCGVSHSRRVNPCSEIWS
jgi:hypothetical protein